MTHPQPKLVPNDAEERLKESLNTLVEGLGPEVVIELADGLLELAKAVRDQKKSGDITLKAKITPVIDGGIVDKLHLVPTVKLTAPRGDIPARSMYLTKNGIGRDALARQLMIEEQTG